MEQTRAWAVVVGAALAAACSSDELPRNAGAGKPLPECPGIDTTPCDTRASSCQDRLLSLAACMYGVDQKPDVPIRVATVDELLDELGASEPNEDPADDERSVHFERAMVELLLMQPGDLTGDGGTTEDFIDRIDGFYVDAQAGITLVDRGMPNDTPAANALLLHEFVHAIQDAEYDLDSLDAGEPADFDAELARRSVAEGQATLYQYRAGVVMMGRDATQVDWELSFEQLRNEILGYALKDSSPLFAAPTTFPYAHGALLAYRAWENDGPLYHAAQFGNLPRRTLDVMTASFQAPPVADAPELVEPPLPEPYISVDHGTLGAFLVQLFAHRAGANSNRAEELGLAWRADSIWICRNADQTGYLWELAFDTPEHARQLETLPDLPANLTIESRNERLFLAGSGTPPDFLVQTGRTWLGRD